MSVNCGNLFFHNQHFTFSDFGKNYHLSKTVSNILFIYNLKGELIRFHTPFNNSVTLMVIHSPPPQGSRGLSLYSSFFQNCLWHNPNSTRMFETLRSQLSCQCQAMDNRWGARQSGVAAGEPALGEGNRRTRKGCPPGGWRQWLSWRLTTRAETELKCERGGWRHWESLCSGEPGGVAGTGEPRRPTKGSRAQGLGKRRARIQAGKVGCTKRHEQQQKRHPPDAGPKLCFISGHV